MKVFLIGLMGSGKTTLGLQLAEKLNYSFVDTDDWIIQHQGTDINSIFKHKGENYFRELERQCIKNISIDNVVISTGGGLPCYQNNMALINEIGISIWLQPSIDTLVKRLWNNSAKRPLIRNCIDESDLRAKLQYVEDKRSRFYSQSKYTIIGNEISINDIVQRIDIA